MSCWHSGVFSTPLSPRYVVPHCVSVSPLDDSHWCLSDKTVFKVFEEEEIEGRETLCLHTWSRQTGGCWELVPK